MMHAERDFNREKKYDRAQGQDLGLGTKSVRKK